MHRGVGAVTINNPLAHKTQRSGQCHFGCRSVFYAASEERKLCSRRKRWRKRLGGTLSAFYSPLVINAKDCPFYQLQHLMCGSDTTSPRKPCQQRTISNQEKHQPRKARGGGNGECRQTLGKRDLFSFGFLVVGGWVISKVNMVKWKEIRAK